VLTGTAADDRMNGEGGDDTLVASRGLDRFIGGADIADYSGPGAFVSVSPASGFAGGRAGSHAIGDVLRGIENLRGSVHDDILSADGGANRLDGGAGADVLQGYGGADVFAFRAGFGADTVADFEDGTDPLAFSGHTGRERDRRSDDHRQWQRMRWQATAPATASPSWVPPA